MLLDGWKFGHLNHNMSHLYQTLLISSVMILTDFIIEQENLTAHVEIFMSIPFTFENWDLLCLVWPPRGLGRGSSGLVHWGPFSFVHQTFTAFLLPLPPTLLVILLHFTTPLMEHPLLKSNCLNSMVKPTKHVIKQSSPPIQSQKGTQYIQAGGELLSRRRGCDGPVFTVNWMPTNFQAMLHCNVAAMMMMMIYILTYCYSYHHHHHHHGEQKWPVLVGHWANPISGLITPFNSIHCHRTTHNTIWWGGGEGGVDKM